MSNELADAPGERSESATSMNIDKKVILTKIWCLLSGCQLRPILVHLFQNWNCYNFLGFRDNELKYYAHYFPI